jgi:uncharacterized protein (TIGR02118 family)
MIKMIFMLKRRAGMSRAEFERYYESNHAKLGEKHVVNAARYVRRYLKGLPEPLTGAVTEPDFDVITELWFETQSDMDAAMKHLMNAEVVQEIAADEDRLFDRSRNRVYLVEEVDSPVRLSADRGAAS